MSVDLDKARGVMARVESEWNIKDGQTVRDLIAEVERLRRVEDENKTLRRIPRGEVWYWAGDEEDHPESLGCPVIMEPDVLRAMLAEVERLKKWVNDCQSGMYVNCVYCGHRYGPSESTPVAMADVLREHIEQCPDHPLSAARVEIEKLRDRVTALEAPDA